ncbi:MAG: stage II sporulation protein P [Clostridia bacterium]|nr:stage II sporulation protein P [Clostridia bacterium]
MKRILILICEILIILSFTVVFASDFHIVKSPQAVSVDGSIKDFEVYNIDGNNFFKLRDIAFVLNGTNSQFSVTYDEAKKVIETIKGEAYNLNGSEMKIGIDNSSSAVKSSQTLNINGQENDLLAYNIAGNNFFKLRDLASALDFLVDYNETTNTVVIESKKNSPIANITNLFIKNYNDTVYVEITSDNPILSYKDFSIFEEENNRIVLDISDSNIKTANNQIDVNQGGIKKIRIGNQGGNLNRFVLDLESSTTYKVFQSNDKQTMYIVLSDNISFNEITGESDIISEPNIPETNTDIIEIVESGENIIIENESSNTNSGENSIDTPVDAYTEEELNNRIKITSVKYSSSNNRIKVTGDKTFKYTEYSLENPYIIMYDIENAVLSVDGPTSITPKNKIINEIRFYQIDEMTVRVEIETDSKAEYISTMQNHVLEISVKEKTYQNLTYSSDNAGGIVTLNDVKKDVFSITEDTKSNKYTIKYSESRFTCGKETLTINDDWINTIQISTGKIVLQGKSDVSFTMEQNGDDVIVKITGAEDIIINPVKTNTNTNTQKTVQTSHRYTVNRTSTFNVTQISTNRVLVGKAYINNSSGPELDLDALKKKSNIAINSNTNILIYHTHTTEGYLESGIESNFHTTDTSNGVVAAGSELEKYLLLKKINVLHDTSRHDTSYNDAYDDSLEYLENITKQQTFDIAIDLHRDAVSSNLYYAPTTTINGEKCAKLMFVMGSNAYGLEHPNWLENLKVAILIQNKAEEMYPGLFRDISLVKWRYNQHMSPGGMLIEVGSTGNSMSEVKNSMKYLANVFAALDK